MRIYLRPEHTDHCSNCGNIADQDTQSVWFFNKLNYTDHAFMCRECCPSWDMQLEKLQLPEAVVELLSEIINDK
jgi:hypothetical protein